MLSSLDPGLSYSVTLLLSYCGVSLTLLPSSDRRLNVTEVESIGSDLVFVRLMDELVTEALCGNRDNLTAVMAIRQVEQVSRSRPLRDNVRLKMMGGLMKESDMRNRLQSLKLTRSWLSINNNQSV